MNTRRIAIALSLLLLLGSCTRESKYTYVEEIENCNYHQVATWFAYPELLTHYEDQLEKILDHSMFDVLVFSRRGHMDMLDTAVVNPMYRYTTKRAAEKNVLVGIQYPWTYQKLHRADLLQSLIFDGESRLDASGSGVVTIDAFGPRYYTPLSAKVYKAYSFIKRGDGLFEPGSLREITHLTTVTLNPDKRGATATVQAPDFVGGRTVFVMAEFTYDYPTMYGGIERFLGDVLATSQDIPFRASMLDEFTFMKLVPPWSMKPEDRYRGRYYSSQMDSAFRALYGVEMGESMLSMRYVPERHESDRMQAINRFMALTRDGAQQAQASYYDQAKQTYGPDSWLGSHSTFHNQLGGDEVTSTGAIWWTAKRDFGQTDEWTPTPTRMGVLYAYPARIMYNMFYDPSEDTFYEKVLTDLRYNIRTNYHAINDYTNQWGVTFDTPEQLEKTKIYERAARLLNRFDADKPQVDVLVVFGMEALCNWYPDTAARTNYDIRRLEIEEKVVALEKAGYRTALVPSDLIRDGILTLSPQGKPTMNGHEFQAMLFLYPEYSREGTLTFVEKYLAAGGKLMLEGEMTHDFDGRYVADRYAAIKQQAVAPSFRVADMPKLGVSKNVLESGSVSRDGSVILTDYLSLKNNTTASFSVELDGDLYTGTYQGMLAFQPVGGEVVKLASIGLQSLEKNGKTLLSFTKPVKLYLEEQDGVLQFTFIDPAGEKPTPTVNNL